MKKYEDIKTAICPKCGQEYTGRPALSRADNKTMICPDCGIHEALIRTFYSVPHIFL